MSFERLEGLILSTFYLTVRFSRETTEYYSSRWRRVKDTMKPDQTNNATLNEIRKNAFEIRNECEVLMLIRIDSLHKKLEGISIGQANADAQLKQAKESSDARYLAELRPILGVQDASPHLHLEKYKTLLISALFSGNLRSRHYRPKEISMELLREDVDFNNWWESTKSCVLLAGGTNFVDEHSSGTLNWLSYGAVLAVEELRQQNRNCAFFLAQTRSWVQSKRRCTLRQILLYLINQIAAMHSDLLRSRSTG
jgi:hypothetical protein